MRSSSQVRRFRRIPAFVGGTLLALVACTSSNKTATDAAMTSACSPAGAATQGPADTHCVVDGKPIAQSTDMASCLAGNLDAGDGVGTGIGDASVPDGGDCSLSLGYGPTLYGHSGSDDDCKYDVTWTSTPICLNQNVYFTVTATNRTDHTPVTGANVRPDVTLDCTYPIMNVPADPSPEGPPGTYKVGPIVFDMPGTWTVRFHFYYECYHLVPTSPHGHAAFWVTVP